MEYVLVLSRLTERNLFFGNFLDAIDVKIWFLEAWCFFIYILFTFVLLIDKLADFRISKIINTKNLTWFLEFIRIYWLHVLFR